jgi:hypothetical protein
MNAWQVWSDWRERRHRMCEVRQAIRNGTLGDFHRERHGTFTVEAEIHRTEELRPEVLGVPSEDELHDRPHDPWRPARTLGKLPE